MNKLTLPIEIGKKYVRRDGEVVLASRQIYDNLIIQADDSGELKDFVFQSNGAGTSNPKFSEKYFYDLVADYVEEDVKAGHTHATKMMEYAQDALETDKPWERWEFKVVRSVWSTCTRHPIWGEDYVYRRKPRTMG